MSRQTHIRSAFSSLLAVFLLWCAPVHAQKPVMTWMGTNQAPSSMPVDGQFTVGITDVITKAIIQEWPEAEHRVLVVTSARAMQNLTEGQQACFHNPVITPERERVAYFSTTLVAPPIQLIARADAVAKLPKNAAGEVLPSTLFDRSDMRGLITPGRSYGALLDTLLRLRPKNSGINTVALNDGGSNVFKMLALGRGDYTIDYTLTLAYQQSLDTSLAGEQGLVSLPIAGGTSIYVGIACPHTVWGRETIQKIDGILSRISARPEYVTALLRWMPPEAQKRYRNDMVAFAKLRTRPTDPEKFSEKLIGTP